MVERPDAQLKDLLFTIDTIKAAIKASPGELGGLRAQASSRTTITSISTPNPTTLVVNLKTPVNPTWITEDILTRHHDPMPDRRLGEDVGERPIVPTSGRNPANA